MSTCRVCDVCLAPTATGLMRSHLVDGARCPGSRQLPTTPATPPPPPFDRVHSPSCLAHPGETEPCSTCASYIAAGL